MMTTKQYWTLPEGIEEALPEQSARFEKIRRRLLDMYATWGYELVMPPTIDFIESLLTGTGHDLDLKTFKLVDQLSGRTLGIRADMTPQVARMDAHQLQHDTPNRLCYIGTVLQTTPESLGDSRSPLQVGAELYGCDSVDAEIEVISLMLATFSSLKINNIYLDIGNVAIYRRLAEQAKLSKEVESQLFEMMQRKAVTEIDSLLATLTIDDELKKLFTVLPTLHGDQSVFEKAKKLFKATNKSVNDAIDDLQKTVEKMTQRHSNIKLHIDFSELYGYHYKTGIVFAAFVNERGQAIARGGRYNAIGKLFGQSRPATGFSTDLKLLSQLSDISFKNATKILAPNSDSAQKNHHALQIKIAELRAQGITVIQQLSHDKIDLKIQAKKMNCSAVLQWKNKQWVM